jgi:glycosyltransferase involved in cell wall biosynthesis
MSRFPHLPETFILREMSSLEHHGWRVALYPLLLQQQPVVHAAARPWLARAQRLPMVSPQVLAANGRAGLRNLRRYSRLWQQVVWGHCSSRYDLLRALVLFPKAVYAARLMQQAGVRHIHAHYATYPALVAWIIHCLTGLSYSVTVHAHDIFVRTTMLTPKLRAAAFIVAISAYNREYLAKLLGAWVRPKTHVIHCGITPQDYQSGQPFPGSGTRFEIISIGSLQPYKGYSYLVQACALLRDRGLPLHCRIIGGGEERRRLERLIAEARLTGVVTLLGPQPQEVVARLLPTAHCYVQPSVVTPAGKMEGIPVALMEALACNLPVVATALSGVPELVRPGETGYLVPPADAPALAEALATVYAQPDAAARLATRGRDLVRQEFTLSTNVARLAALFAQVTQHIPPVGRMVPAGD